MAPLTYQYSESGLDYVFLKNGFVLENDPQYGELITIQGVSDLHERLDQILLVQAPYLDGAAMRLFRVSALEQTPEDFAMALGMTTTQIKELESARAKPLPEEIDHAVRRYVIEALDRSEYHDAADARIYAIDPYQIVLAVEDGKWVGSVTLCGPGPLPSLGR